MSLRYNLNCPRLSPDCTKCYGMNQDGTINRHEWMTPVCQNPSCSIPSSVELRRVGTDRWSRHLYETRNGMVLCDTNLGHGELRLCTMTDEGEPDCPVHFAYHIIERYAEIVYQPNATPELPYNVKIITNGQYCGFGRFCRTEAEAKRYTFDNWGDIEIREAVPQLPEPPPERKIV